MLKTYSIKVCLLLLSLPASFLYEPRRQNHDIIQFGDTIILQAYTLKPTSYTDTFAQIHIHINL